MWITPLAHRFVGLVVTALAMTVAVTTTVSAQQGAMYELVSSFQVAEGRPNGVIQTRDGQFYGTTAGGGAAAAPPLMPTGTVFAMDAAGARTTLHTFYSCGSFCATLSDGTPLSNLFEGADGNLN